MKFNFQILILLKGSYNQDYKIFLYVQFANDYFSKGANKYTSPYKQSKNNRRNLSIKQSWDNPHILNKNFLLNSQAKNSAVANFGKTFNKVGGKWLCVVQLF